MGSIFQTNSFIVTVDLSLVRFVENPSFPKWPTILCIYNISKYFIEQSFEVSCIKLIRRNENVYIFRIYRLPSRV